MDLVTGIASSSIGLSSSRTLTDVNVALMGKALDTAEAQGQALREMMEAAPPDFHQLDVYA